MKYRVPTELLTQEGRRQSVLVLRGTGLNIWHYYPFLRCFTLQELSEFRRVYAASGGAVVLWFYCLARQSAFDDRKAVDFDSSMRKFMNQRSLAKKCIRFLQNKHLYTVDDNLNLIREFVSKEAALQTFEQHPLGNVSIVAQDEVKDELIVVRPETHGDWNVSRLLSLIVTTSTAYGRRLCYRDPYLGFQLGDFEFSSDRVRLKFKEILSKDHSNEEIYYINIYRTRSRGRIHFVKASGDRWPRFSQALDFLRFFTGIPNGRYVAAYSGTTFH